jgi:preprotein translocase subunit SecE
VARDRQRAKQRQAARRAERLGERRAGEAAPRTSEPDEGLPPDAVEESDLEELADLEVGAPPRDTGRSDSVLEAPPNPYDADVLEDAELESDGDGARVATGPVGHRGERAAPTQRGRLVAFLIAVWAELGRVQWPDRRQLMQLTGVVLFFVLVVGGYLGGLDAIFSKLISLIL